MRSTDFPENYTPDDTVYHVTVKVQQLAGSDNLLAYYTVRLSDEAQEKQDDMLFITTYSEPEPEPENPVTPNPSNPDPTPSNPDTPKPEEVTAVSPAPTTTTKTSTANTPKTGDTTSNLVWTVAMGCVIIGILVCMGYLGMLHKHDQVETHHHHHRHHHGT
jgi:cell division septation protein DedD